MKIIELAKLSRIHKPIPILMLFLPCAWGIALASHGTNVDQILQSAKFIFLFLIGSICMRSAGCIINDIVDRDIDKYVKRTKNRPLAVGTVSIPEAIGLLALCCLCGLVVFLQLNTITQIICIIGCLLMIVYPFCKRIMHQPQLILGMAFNIGSIAGYATIQNTISNGAIMLYLSGIAWAMIYDTIYAIPDAKYDIGLNLGSSAILYKRQVKKIMMFFLFIMNIGLILAGLLEFRPLAWEYYFTLEMAMMYQIRLVYQANLEDAQSCQKTFETNAVFGTIVLIAIILGRVGSI